MISVFKTSVTNMTQIETLKPLLDKHFENAKWNFDLEDCDKILRIESRIEIAKTTINLLQNNGFNCEELLD